MLETEKVLQDGVESWPPRSNHPKPYVDPAFERELLRIGGSTIDGKSRLRLVWGQDPTATVFYRGEQRLRYLHHFREEIVAWEAIWYDEGGKEKMRKRLPFSTSIPKADGARIVQPIVETIDVGIPRWFIEQYMPPEVACLGHAEHRYEMDYSKGEMVDELGPAPTQGQYEEAFYMIADHTRCCPKDRKSGCPGLYRAPDALDLEYCRYMFWALNQEPYRYDWTEMPPRETILQDHRDRFYDSERVSEADRAETEYAMRNRLMTHRNRIFGGGHGLDRFTYHDLGAATARARKF